LNGSQEGSGRGQEQAWPSKEPKLEMGVKMEASIAEAGISFIVIDITLPHHQPIAELGSLYLKLKLAVGWLRE
jgi:hypothetical protein